MVLKKEVLRHYLNQWDPADLMWICPVDEYDPEVKKIILAARFVENLDAHSLAKIIQKVFDKQFNFDHWGNPMPSHSFNDTVEDILPIARNIINACK